MACAGQVKHAGGRPPLPEDQRLVHVSIRLTATQADQLFRLAIRERVSTGVVLRALLGRILSSCDTKLDLT